MSEAGSLRAVADSRLGSPSLRMSTSADIGLIKSLRIFASAASVFSIAVGVSGLAGWKFHITTLLTWGDPPVRMVPNAAACLVLLGISLGLQGRKDNQSFAWARKLSAKTLAAIVCLVGLLTLAEHIFGWDFGIDQLWVVVPSGEKIPGLRPGLFATTTSCDFVLLSVALMLLDWQTRRDDWPAQYFCIWSAMAGIFGLFALILQPHASGLTMALPPAVTSLVLAGGVIGSRAPWAIGGLLTSPSAGARLLRRVLPTALLVLGFIGWSISKALLTEAHFTWVEASLLAIACGAALMGFITWIAFILERSDVERRRAETALGIGKEQLDRLMDRTEEPESERRLLRKVRWAFAVALLLTVLLGLLSWHNAQLAAADADWVAHTYEVSTTLELTLRHLIDIETGGLGFSLTGDERLLEPYETGKEAVARDLLALRVLVANQNQQLRLEVLLEQARTQIEDVDEAIAARRIRRSAPTAEVVERGKRLMDAARATVAQMEAQENRLLEQRSRRARAAQHFTISVIALGSVVGVVFLSMAGVTVSREIGISARARAQLDALNTDLERRVAERTAALGESESRLASVIQSAMDAIITVDEQQRILLFNTAAQAMFRCPAQEAVGSPLGRFIPQRFRAAHVGHYQHFHATGTTHRAMGKLGVLAGLRSDGTEFPVEIAISQMEAAGQKMFTAIVRDVSERQRTEEALRESEQRYRLVFNEMLMGFALFEVVYDENGKPCDHRYLEVNPAFETHTGLTRDRVLGKTIREVLPGIEPFWIETYGKVATTGESVHVENYAQPLQRWFEVTAFRTHAGYLAVTFADISERKRAAEVRERLAAIVNSSDDAIISKDLNGTINAWNRGAEKVFGYSASEVLGKPMLMLFPPDRVNEEAEILARIRRGESVEHFETVRIRKDGKSIDVSVTISPIRDSSGTIVGASKIARDITARRQSENQLAVQAKELSRKMGELARSNADLEQFAYVASHDLQEPLRMVTAYTQLLAERYSGNLDENADKFIGYASEGAQRMQVLIQDLLAFSRVGRNGFAHGRVDCNAVLDEVLQALAAAIQESGAVVTHAELPAVWADRTQVAQIFQNLVGNALKFRGEAPPVVSVQAERTDDHWLFRVSDNGIGIAPEEAEGIFVAFRRLHTRAEYPGNGIGLAICKKIIEHCGGKIWVQSQAGQGATFKFTLPCQGPDGKQGARA